MSRPYPTTHKLLEGKQREGSTSLKESRNNHLKLKAHIFLRILFSRKIAIYYKILSEHGTIIRTIVRIIIPCSEAATRKFRKFLVTLQVEGVQ